LPAILSGVAVTKSISILLLSFGSLGLTLSFSDCGPQNRSRRLIIYSPHGKEMLSEFEKRFERSHPGVDVQWIDMGSQDVLDRVRTERGNPQADLWWGAPSTMFMRAEREGLLEPYVPTWDNVVDSAYKSRGAFWYGTFLTPEVIAYNTRLVKRDEAPQDWDELLDAKWRDRIIIRYPLASGTMRGVFTSILARAYAQTGKTDEGFMWLLRLDANTKSYAADPTQLYLKLAREEGAVTIWDMPDIVIQEKKNGYPFGYISPRSGTVVLTEGIALIKGSRNRETAKEFYEFATTKESMILQAQNFYRIPTRSDIARSELPSWITQEKIKVLDVDWNLVLDHEQDWMRYWDEKIKGRGRSAETSLIQQVR
jgi:iron(III) transport system substrate-binding protein